MLSVKQGKIKYSYILNFDILLKLSVKNLKYQTQNNFRNLQKYSKYNFLVH